MKKFLSIFFFLFAFVNMGFLWLVGYEFTKPTGEMIFFHVVLMFVGFIISGILSE